MNILLVLLRLIHIVGAFAWVGLGGAMSFYIIPATVAAGETGFRYMKSLFTQPGFAMIFPSVSGITTLAGILLYLVGDAASHFSQTGNIVLGIGAISGLAAAIHGGAVLGRTSRTVGQTVVQLGSALSDADKTQLNELTLKLLTQSRHSLILMVVALVCMGSARYL
ncbi:MAG: hypothetical protein GC179_00905 [Anaerolineaceae bacterium]|nr:hypothetical protein [Anaerolineaceae bacterium]